MPFYKVPNITSPPTRPAGIRTSGAPVGHTQDQTTGSGGNWSDEHSRASIAEMTEADRDSELLRLSNLEHKIGIIDIHGEMNTAPGGYNKGKRGGDITDSPLPDRESGFLTHQTASPAGSTWSVDSAATGSTGSTGGGRGGGVDGEKRYAHAGESLIARELKDQQERENELRGRWKEMGLDVPDTSSVGETPFTIPQPLPEPPACFPSRISSAPSELDVSEGTCSDSGIAEAEKSPTGSSMTSSFRRVQPIDDPDEADGGKIPYAPTNETPIEREIRLSRQREEDLRQERGLPPSRLEGRSDVGQDSVDSSRIGLSPSGPGPEPGTRRDGGGYPNATGTLKKLANNRLQMELSKEKQRELELKTEGVIHTISEDRKGGDVRYVDVISKQQEQQNHSSLAPVGHRTKKSSVSQFSDEGIPPSESSVLEDTSSVHQRNGDRSASEMGDSELLRRFATKQNKQYLNGDTDSGSVKTQAEQKIHEELNELLRREHELRQRQNSGTGDVMG